MSIQGIIAIILVLGGLIFFHELGHFLLARIFKVGVKTFSLGFGPKLWGFTYGRTLYKISFVPLGGYVQMVGESPEAEAPEEFSEDEYFINKPPWQRMLIAASGPGFNFLLAWVIYWALIWNVGYQERLPIIADVVQESPAEQAGLQAGDRIVRIDGQPVEYWTHVVDSIMDNPGTPLSMTVKRGAENIALDVTPAMQTRKNLFGEEIQVPMIGIQASEETVSIDVGFWQSALEGGKQTWFYTKLTVEGIIKLIERIIPMKEIGGPIMIAQLVNQQAEKGVADVLALTALISINLALLNLLPIPVLDGGHILFYGIETIIRRPLDVRLQQIAIRIGITLLLALMALAVYNDIARMFTTNN